MRSQTSAQQELAGGMVKDYERLKSQRGNYESQCREIAERYWPSQLRLWNGTEWTARANEGEKRGQDIYDSTPVTCLNKFASILDDLLTPMNQIWHHIVGSTEEVLQDRASTLWMEQLTRNLFRKRYSPDANFVSQNQLVYKGMGAYGNSALFVDEYKTRRGRLGFRYRNIHAAQLFFLENHQGVVDEVLRVYTDSARNVYKKWGENCPDFLIAKAKSAPEEVIVLIHRVRPREGVDYERADYAGMEWESCYAMHEKKWLLEESGYTTFPYAVGRYEQVPGEVIARSPAMDCLAATKTLNEQKKTILTHGQRVVDPPLFGHDDGTLDLPNTRPGAYNSGGVSADGKMLVHTLPMGNIMLGKELADDERQTIKDNFLVPLFELVEKNPQMTATEVLQRVKEKSVFLAPTVGRQYAQYHGNFINREIDLELQQNPQFMDQMPPLLREAGGQYGLRYDSPMARMARAEEATGLMQTVETAIKIATETQNPEPLDHFNWDRIMPELADIGGVPKRWLNDMKTIMGVRQNRQESQQQQQDIQAAPGVAAITKAGAVARKTA